MDLDVYQDNKSSNGNSYPTSSIKPDFVRTNKEGHS